MSLSELEPEEKVNLAISMTDVCVRVCADGIRDRHPEITEEELVEKVRERITCARKREARLRRENAE